MRHRTACDIDALQSRRQQVLNQLSLTELEEFHSIHLQPDHACIDELQEISFLSCLFVTILLQ